MMNLSIFMSTKDVRCLYAMDHALKKLGEVRPEGTSILQDSDMVSEAIGHVELLFASGQALDDAELGDVTKACQVGLFFFSFLFPLANWIYLLTADALAFRRQNSHAGAYYMDV